MFDSIEEAIEDVRLGKMVIVADDEDRENEGDFIMAAEKITPEAINFMAVHGRGLICTPLLLDKARELHLDPMVPTNTSQHDTAFTVSIDLLHGNTTGISAADRYRTIKTMTSDQARPDDFVRPGHIFPLIAKDGGVLRRAGHTEAAVDLAALAGFKPMGVICEIMNPDGSMSRVPELRDIANEHGLKFITIKDLIKYRRSKEKLIRLAGECKLPNAFGDFRLVAYESTAHQGEHHLALVKGDISPERPCLVRVHSECFTGDIFGSRRCDCGDQLQAAMEMIEREGEGIFLYMRQEGRGIGLINKIKAYQIQEEGLDTVEANHRLGLGADLRDYGVGAQILLDLGVRKMRLLTNNPKKVVGLKGHDLQITERVPLEMPAKEENFDYLKTKRDKLGHLLMGGPVSLQ